MSKVGRRRQGARIALVLGMLALALPASAVAKLPPGVHVDPGSPAAKEYSIPLGAARGNGQSGSSSSSSLFGAGITKAGGSGGSGSSGSGSSGSGSSGSGSSGSGSSGSGSAGSGSGGSGTASSSAATPTNSTAPAASHAAVHHHARRHRAKHSTPAPATHTAATPAFSPQRAIGTSSSSGIGITWMLGAAVIVLLLGALGGTALARRGRRHDARPADARTSPSPS